MEVYFGSYPYGSKGFFTLGVNMRRIRQEAQVVAEQQTGHISNMLPLDQGI